MAQMTLLIAYLLMDHIGGFGLGAHIGVFMVWFLHLIVRVQ